MSVIEVFKIKNQLLNLEENIKKLKLLFDPVTFRFILNDSIKLMSIILKMTRNGLRAKNIAAELLINILSFLPNKCISISQSVCKNWSYNLNNNLAKKILQKIPKNMTYSKSLDLNFPPRLMMNLKNDIYVISKDIIYTVDVKKFEIYINEEKKIDKKTYRISSNKNFICMIQEDTASILSHNMKLINKWEVPSHWNHVETDDDYIYILGYDKIHIYDFKGNIIKKWIIKSDYSDIKRFAVHNKKIFIVDTDYNNIKVFSHEGILIRQWGKTGHESGNFTNPWGITIYRNIVFIVDSGNSRIQAFTCKGKFIFEYIHEEAQDLTDIIIIDEYAYINDWKQNNIIKLKLNF